MMATEKMTEKEDASIDSEVLEAGVYKFAIKEAFTYGTSLNFSEFRFGVDKVDTAAVTDFMKSLVDFIEETEEKADEEELKSLYTWGNELNDELFSGHQNLISFIPLPERMKLMTKATRSKVIQSTFGSVFVGNTVYSLSFMEEKLDDITLKIMEDLTIPERLDLLHQLRTVGAQAVANGNWSRPAYEQVCQTYVTIMSSSKLSVFERLAAEAGLETLEAEYENPQLDFVRLQGQTNQSRLANRFSDEQIKSTTDQFFSKYKLDKVVSNTTTLVPAARDALVLRDNSGLASGIVRLDVETFLKEADSDVGFDINHYKILLLHLESNYKPHVPQEQNDEVTVTVFKDLITEYTSAYVEDGNAEGAAEVCSKMFKILTKAEWQIYFLGEISRQQFPVQSDAYEDSLDANAEASKKFITDLLLYSEKLGEKYIDDFQHLKEALNRDDLEQAFQISSSITTRCFYEAKKTAYHHEVINLKIKIKDTHRSNLEKALERYSNTIAELEETKEIQMRAAVVQKLDDGLDELHNQMHSFIVGKLKTISDLPQIKLIPLKELVAEIKGRASFSGVSDEDVLLFQHVHSSELAEKIEHEFAFALSDLYLKEQYFFLNYIKRITSDSIESMKSFISLYGVNGIRTFLSLERGDVSFGDAIVAFGQHDEVAGTVFKYYGELLDSAERAETLVKQVSDCEGEACVALANQVRENILNRAQKDLEKAVRATDPGEVADQIENYVASAKEYVALLQEVGAGKIESVSPESLTEEDRSRMQNLLQANYRKAYPDPENDAFKAAVSGSLSKSFSNPNTSFRVLRDKGKIVSYNRFDTLRDYTGREISYFGSFNADPAYSGVGGIMLEQTIKDELESGQPMMAHCDPAQAITKKYIEDGFVATNFYPLAGKPSFEIWRSNESTTPLESKNLAVADLVKRTELGGSILVREQDQFEHYPELREGKALTRYFAHEGKTYLVFEKLPPSLQEAFLPPQEDLKEAA